MNHDDDGPPTSTRTEDPDTVSGAVGGAAGGGTGAALGFATFGPIGAVLGALAGAVGGWWAGREFERTLPELDRATPALRRAHEDAGAPRSWGEVEHAHRLGFLAGRNPDYHGRGFSEVEPELEAAWAKHHEQTDAPSWPEIRPAALRGFRVGRTW